MSKKPEKRNFYLIVDGKETEHKYVGRRPRQAASKAVNDGNTKFGLREAGESKVHLFEGRIEWVAAPEKLPEYVKPNAEGKVKKAVVRKLGIQK